MAAGVGRASLDRHDAIADAAFGFHD